MVNKFNCRIKLYIIMNAANLPPKIFTASNSIDDDNTTAKL